jgi:hypothetical protein
MKNLSLDCWPYVQDQNLVPSTYKARILLHNIYMLQKRKDVYVLYKFSILLLYPQQPCIEGNISLEVKNTANHSHPK